MSYKEFAPPPTLSNVIECVWTRVPDANAQIEPRPVHPPTQTILPDGAMDIIATYHPDGECNNVFVVGAMTGPQLASLGNDALVGVRFLPGAGGSALGINAATLTNEQADVRDVFKHTDVMREAFRALRVDSGSAHALQLFANSIALQERAVPPLVRRAAKMLAQQSSTVRIEHVAKELHITRQHLSRVFSAHSGLTPKLFAQVCRVRALLAEAQTQFASSRLQTNAGSARQRNSSSKAGSDRWSMLALDFGYVDQSHLIAEVHAIIGETPAAWQSSAGSNIPIVPVPVGPL